MADVVIDPMVFGYVTGPTTNGTATVGLQAGELVKTTTANTVYGLADAVDDSACSGILVTPLVGSDLGAIVATKGAIVDVGAVLTKGGVYALSKTAGGLAPIADIVTPDYLNIVGYALSVNQLKLMFEDTKTQL